jgi:hypothetical protein
VHWSLLRETSNGLSVRLVPVLVPSSEELWLRGLAGGTVDPYHSHVDLTIPLQVHFLVLVHLLCRVRPRTLSVRLAYFAFSCVLRGFSRLLPETLRAIVGDGSIPAGWIYTRPISLSGRHRGSDEISIERPARQPFKNPLLIFAYPEVLVLLIFNGTLYAVMYGVTAGLSIIFERVYPYLNEAKIGLCFIPMGLGLLVGSLFSGRAMDSCYRKIKEDLIRQIRADSERHVDPETIEKDPSFPIEKARLQILPWVVFVFTTCVISYGWALRWKVTIAVPLILQFISEFFTRYAVRPCVSSRST